MATCRLRLLAAAFLGAILSLTLTGCGDDGKEGGKKGAEQSGFVATSCHILVAEVVVAAQGESLKFAKSECAALKAKASAAPTADNSSGDLEIKCLDKVGKSIIDPKASQMKNFTDQCVKAVGTATQGNSTNMVWAKIEELFNELSASNDWQKYSEQKMNSGVKKQIDSLAKKENLGEKPKDEDETTKKPAEEPTEKPVDPEDETTKKPTDKPQAEKTTEAPKDEETTAKPKSSRLYDSSVHIPSPGGVDGVAVLGLVGGVTMVALGFAVRSRQGVRRHSGHDALAGEGSELGDA